MECIREECDQPAKTRELCQRHYMQAYRSGAFTAPCSVEGCDRPSYALGLCMSHRRDGAAAPGKRCGVKSCRAAAISDGRCEKHPRPPTGPVAWVPPKAPRVQRPCAVEMCSQPEFGRLGLCNNHRQLMRSYGLTLDEVVTTQRWKSEGRLCDSCAHRTGEVVDHDHTTGVVRGWLCSWCNTMLGYAEDSPPKLRAAAAYLERTAGERLLIV